MTVVAAGATTSSLAAGLLLVAGAGHLLAIPHHADPGHGGPWQASGFALVAVAQVGGAAALAVRPLAARRRFVVLVATAVFVGLWGVSRTVGLPYGQHPGMAEPVGRLDAVTVVAQVGIVALLARTGATMPRPVPRLLSRVVSARSRSKEGRRTPLLAPRTCRTPSPRASCAEEGSVVG